MTVFLGDEVGFWTFDNESNPNQNSASGGLNLVFSSGIDLYDSEIGGKCVDISNCYATLPTQAKTPKGSFTIALWVKHSDSTNNNVWYINQRSNSSPGPSDWQIFALDSSGSYVRFTLFPDNGENKYGVKLYPSFLPVDKWVHLCVVVDNNNKIIKGYANGILIDQSSFTGTPSNNSTSIIVGGRGWSPSVGRITGFVDELRVYHRAITDSEVLQISSSESEIEPYNFVAPTLSFGETNWTGTLGKWGGTTSSYSWELRKSDNTVVRSGTGVPSGINPPEGHYYLSITTSGIEAVSKQIEHVTAEGYISRLEAFGRLSSQTKESIRNFINGCREDQSPIEGISNWDAIKTSCLLIGPRKLSQALIPLKGPSITNNNFLESDYSAIKGLKGNAYDKWLYTGLTAGSFDYKNCSLSFFTTEPEGESSEETFGGINVSSNSKFRIGSINSTTKTIDIGYANNISSTTKIGFSGGSKWGDMPNGVETLGVYGDSSYALNTGGVGFNESIELRVFRSHGGSLGEGFTQARIGFYHYGDPVDLIALKNRLETYIEEVVGDYDPEALEYINKVEVADGMELPDRVKEAINNFIVGCKSDDSPNSGISNWDAIKVCCLLAGPKTLTGSLVPLKGPAPTKVGNSFYKNSLYGIKSYDSGSYLNANISIAEMPNENISMGVYASEPHETSVLGFYYGAGGNENGATSAYKQSGVVRLRNRNSGTSFVTIEDDSGLIGTSRNSLSSYQYIVGNNVLTQTSNAQSVVDLPMYVFRTSNGFETNYTRARLSFYWAGEAVDLSLLNTRIKEYMDSIIDGIDIDASDYIDRVEAVEGYRLPDHVVRAVSDFVSGCKSDTSPNTGVSNWDAIKTSCFLAGPRTLNGALVPLKGIAPTSFNFTANDYSSALGLKGNGGVKRINSNHAGTEDPQDNCHLMLYITERNTASSSAGYAGQDATTSVSQRSILRHTGTKANSSGASGGIRVDYVGAIGASRASSSVFQSLVDGVLQSHEIESSEPTSANIAIFARNVGGSTGCDARIAFYSIGESVDLELLNNRIKTYMNAIKNGLDEDAQDYINRVELAQKQDLEKHVKRAINKFVVGCKSDESPVEGISNWDAMKAVILLSGSQYLDGALVPLKGSSPTNTGFIQTDYDPLIGLTGSRSTTKNLKWQSLPNNALPMENVSLGAFVTKIPPIGNNEFIATFSLGGSPGMWRYATNGVAGGYLRDAVILPTVSRPANPQPSLLGGSRLGNQKSIRAYRTTSTGTIAATIEPGTTVFALFYWRSNPETSTATISFGWAGEAVDLELLEYRVSTYMRQIKGVNAHILLLAHEININGAL